jgi:hypothetical protein
VEVVAVEGVPPSIALPLDKDVVVVIRGDAIVTGSGAADPQAATRPTASAMVA